MNFLCLAVLAVIQGMAELLPVSSSAHVIVAEKLMGLDPSSPAMTFLLVMLHTGTTAAVIVYFLPRWKARFLGAAGEGMNLLRALVISTLATGVVGFALKHVIEKIWLRGAAKQEVEALFSNLPLIAGALGAAGLLILAADYLGKEDAGDKSVTDARAAWIGAVQGVCLPFRGFSRSGATISTAMLGGVSKALAEDFSFALSVILTPPVVAREALRLWKSSAGTPALGSDIFAPGLVGMVLSFAAGLVALRWLSNWLENGRWKYFGFYCVAAGAALFYFARVIP